MNMIRKITLASLLSLASLAMADTVPSTKTHEVSIFDLRLPVSTSGTVTLRECDDCDYYSIRVTPDTLYRVGNERLELRKFRDRILDLKSSGDITVNVTEDDASNTVTSVFVVTQ